MTVNTVVSDIQTDMGDGLLVLKEVLVVSWRVNPVGISFHLISEACHSVNESTPNEQRAAVIGQALSSIELQGVEEFERVLKEAIICTLRGYREEMCAIAARAYPEVSEVIQCSLSACEQVDHGVFAHLIDSALQGQSTLYTALVRDFRQLRKFLPRYEQLMNRSSVGDWLTGFAAGWFGGYLGAVGAGLWEDWRNSSDAEFLQKFGAAIDNYVQRSIDFVQGGEDALNVVFDRIIEQLEMLNDALLTAYSDLEKQGFDLKPVYFAHRKSLGDIDDDAKQLFAIALRNLSENRQISTKRIANLRQIIGL